MSWISRLQTPMQFWLVHESELIYFINLFTPIWMHKIESTKNSWGWVEKEIGELCYHQPGIAVYTAITLTLADLPDKGCLLLFNVSWFQRGHEEATWVDPYQLPFESKGPCGASLVGYT